MNPPAESCCRPLALSAQCFRGFSFSMTRRTLSGCRIARVARRALRERRVRLGCVCRHRNVRGYSRGSEISFRQTGFSQAFFDAASRVVRCVSTPAEATVSCASCPLCPVLWGASGSLERLSFLQRRCRSPVQRKNAARGWSLPSNVAPSLKVPRSVPHARASPCASLAQASRELMRRLR